MINNKMLLENLAEKIHSITCGYPLDSCSGGRLLYILGINQMYKEGYGFNFPHVSLSEQEQILLVHKIFERIKHDAKVAKQFGTTFFSSLFGKGLDANPLEITSEADFLKYFANQIINASSDIHDKIRNSPEYPIIHKNLESIISNNIQVNENPVNLWVYNHINAGRVISRQKSIKSVLSKFDKKTNLMFDPSENEIYAWEKNQGKKFNLEEYVRFCIDQMHKSITSGMDFYEFSYKTSEISEKYKGVQEVIEGIYLVDLGGTKLIVNNESEMNYALQRLYADYEDSILTTKTKNNYALKKKDEAFATGIKTKDEGCYLELRMTDFFSWIKAELGANSHFEYKKQSANKKYSPLVEIMSSNRKKAFKMYESLVKIA